MIEAFANIDRRIIYLLMIVTLSVPLILESSIVPARMTAADKVYDIIENLEIGQDEIALLALDFGPSTKAENMPQAESVIEHLMRRRIAFALLSQDQRAEGFLTLIPEKVAKRLATETGERWLYGKDWVNLGFRPGKTIFIQSLAKSEDLVSTLKADAFGTPMGDIPVFKNIKTINQIKLLGEFTGLVGIFDLYVQFFQREGYSPTFIHGCTSITIPEAYIYLDSGQLNGLFEGLAGAAWYIERLNQTFPKRRNDPDANDAQVVNTALGVGHLAIIALIFLGNIGGIVMARRAR